MTTVEHTIEVELSNGETLTFDSFADAADHGYPVACQQFALCENAATQALPHPILTAVPTCDRCAAKVEALA